ncbi:uncharacterized protein [Typha latifolia]|uniref:uncharacterized protein isoform X1 n=1 Tax=Typha latifolia TaxID=4733 RepID=UPI003C2D1B0B
MPRLPLRPSLLSPPSPSLSLLPFHLTHLSKSAPFRITKTPLVYSTYRHYPVRLSSVAPVVAEAVTGAEDDEKDEEEERNFVEVGYISSAHGLKGEVRVMPSTDFPELRFGEPGRRWLRTRVAGKELISELELTGGRGHPGQKSWIISFSGIDTVDEARQIVGSTILVREGDRPELEEGDFYTLDLVGMRVVLKDTGKLVGTVTNVFNFGAGDLLQVMLTTVDDKNHSSTSNLDTSSGQHIWIPFVEAIVPDVDMDTKEMLITPPKGLLELNVRSDVRTKKERRLMEWKQKKKLQQRLIAAKKVLSEIGQKHVLEGLRFGEKNQKTSLAKQIASIDFKLFQLAIQSINKPFDSCSLSEYKDTNSPELLKNVIKISRHNLIIFESEGKDNLNYEVYKLGVQLLAKSKAAIVLFANEKNCAGKGLDTDLVRTESMVNQFQKFLRDFNKLFKVEGHDKTVPFIMISSDPEIESCKECLLENDYFGLNSERVWVLEGEKLPIVSISTAQSGNQILLKSPWEILQAPIGSGGIFNLLSSLKINDVLNKMGVEYVQLCSLDNQSAFGNPLFFGLVSSRNADVGVKISETTGLDDHFDMIFSMKHINKICKEINKLRFHALPEQHAHVIKQADNEFITVNAETPNSYHLHCSLYGFLNTCSLENMCVMQVLD